MKFNELANLIQEGMGEDVAKKFSDLFGGDTAPEFISFIYTNKQGERSKYVINVGMGYKRQQENNTIKIENAKKDVEGLKQKLESALQSKAQNGLFNNQPIQAILDSVPQILQKLEEESSQAISRAEAGLVAARGTGYEPIKTEGGEAVKGISYNPSTGKYYIFGPQRSKQVLGEVEYKPTKSRNPVTAGQNMVRKLLELSFPKNFIIDKTNIKDIKVRGEIVELEGEFGEVQSA